MHLLHGDSVGLNCVAVVLQIRSFMHFIKRFGTEIHKLMQTIVETLNMITLTKCRSLTRHDYFSTPCLNGLSSEMGELRNVTPSSPRPTTETLTQSLHDYPLCTVASETDSSYTLLSHSVLSATSHSLSPKVKQYFVHTWCRQICTYCKTSGLL